MNSFIRQETISLRSALFWNITQRIVVIPHRRFGTTYRVPSSRVK